MRFIVFDCDGTLVDSQKSIMYGIESSWNALGIVPPKLSSVLKIVGLSLDDAIERLHSNGDVSTKKALVEEFLNVFLKGEDTTKTEESLFSGVIEILEILNTYNTVMTIVTGKGKQVLNNTFDQLDIGKYFSNSKTAECGPVKPNPSVLN